MPLRYVVRHAIPGRLRLYIPELSGQEPFAQGLVRQLSAEPGVTDVRWRPFSASLVVQYDPGRQEIIERVVSKLRHSSPEPLLTEERSDRESFSIRRAAGLTLFAGAVVGWLLPVVPGTPFFVASVAVLGPNDPVIRRSSEWMLRGKRTLEGLLKRSN